MIGIPPLYGLQIIVNDGVYFVNRTWKERLFTRPWRPCVSTKSKPLIEDGMTLKTGTTLIMNSKTKNDLMNKLEKQ